MHKNPLPVSIGIIPSTVPGNVILVERSDGGIALPGGYVDEAEDTSVALSREIREETGLELLPSCWKLFFSAVTPHNKLLLFSSYPVAVAVPSGFQVNEEVIRVFDAPWDTPLKFALHELALQKWASTLAAKAA